MKSRGGGVLAGRTAVGDVGGGAVLISLLGNLPASFGVKTFECKRPVLKIIRAPEQTQTRVRTSNRLSNGGTQN
jgi:hypothetical protein